MMAGAVKGEPVSCWIRTVTWPVMAGLVFSARRCGGLMRCARRTWGCATQRTAARMAALITGWSGMSWRKPRTCFESHPELLLSTLRDRLSMDRADQAEDAVLVVFRRRRQANGEEKIHG